MLILAYLNVNLEGQLRFPIFNLYFLAIPLIMAKLKISGVWKDRQGEITHYGIHTEGVDSTTRAVKTSKADAIKLVAQSSNQTMTWVWDYKKAFWKDGAKVEVISGSYLRSSHDGILINNLEHLINYNWVIG
jgi:hypothetical protein